tara:strand:- start:19291 stop:19812 length:522 start_codon:yes stop_codon:yes gene_type:complete
MLPGIELRTTAIKGDGVFTTKAFTAGDTVLVGRIEKRLAKNHSHASQIAEHEFVLHAGLTSKFNHSCDPNCGIRLNAQGGHDFVAMCAIDANEEVTFDYAMRNYRVDHFPESCTCGEDACRGSVTGWRDLPQARKDQYEGFVAPYLIEMDAQALDPNPLRASIRENIPRPSLA